MFVDLENETSFSVGLRAKIDAFLCYFYQCSFFLDVSSFSQSKWKRPSYAIVLMKTSSLFLLCLGLDDATHPRACPGDRGVGRKCQMVKNRWLLVVFFCSQRLCRISG